LTIDPEGAVSHKVNGVVTGIGKELKLAVERAKEMGISVSKKLKDMATV